jgi:membrane protease YdiL (CAAX protease family)
MASMQQSPPPPPVWVVLVTYVLAALAILITSIFAGMLLHASDPDQPPAELLQGLEGLVAGALASSAALGFTAFMAARGLGLTRIRMVPGRERGRDLAVMIAGVLSLGQALDSLTTLAGLADIGSMQVIRKALHGATGPELFIAVVVIGVLAGGAEEAFFRGYMQSMLRERLPAWVAIGIASVCFGALHLDLVHVPLAIALGVYMGFVTERAGSALPAVACHVVNNGLYTVLTAHIGVVDDRGINLALGAAAAVLFAGCVAWIHRALPPRP